MIKFPLSYVIQYGSERSIVQFTITGQLFTCIVDNDYIIDEKGVLL